MKAAAVIGRSVLCLAAFAAGAGTMYYFDPEAGTKRRFLARVTALRWLHSARRRAARPRQPDNALENSSDEALLEKVRAELERCLTHPALLSVTVNEGRVLVSGPVRRGETEKVEKCLRRLPVITALQLGISEYANESDMPGLQAQKIWEEQYSFN